MQYTKQKMTSYEKQYQTKIKEQQLDSFQSMLEIY